LLKIYVFKNFENEFDLRRRDIMSQNRTSTDFGGSSSTGTPGSSQSGTGSGSGTGMSSGGTGAGTATGFAQTAQEYGGKITEAATHAKDYVSDKVAVVGEKLKDLQNADIHQVAEDAKEYARKNPGQAILISAAAGLLLGLIIRGRR
jgi:ElaB/YqjD/DUF883 family membrane-anchored ribosome-binding protein